MSINEVLVVLVLIISVIGIITAVICGIISYRAIQKADKEGKFQDYLQEPFSCSGCSLDDALKYLRIVNASQDIEDDKW